MKISFTWQSFRSLLVLFSLMLEHKTSVPNQENVPDGSDSNIDWHLKIISCHAVFSILTFLLRAGFRFDPKMFSLPLSLIYLALGKNFSYFFVFSVEISVPMEKKFISLNCIEIRIYFLPCFARHSFASIR